MIGWVGRREEVGEPVLAREKRAGPGPHPGNTKAKGCKCGREGEAEQPRGAGEAQPSEEGWIERSLQVGEQMLRSQRCGSW